MLDSNHILKNVFYSILIPGIFVVLWLFGLISIATLKLCILGSFIIFFVLPFIFKFAPPLQRGVLFLTFIAHPSSSVLKAPADLGLYGTRNFYVSHRDDNENENVTLGAWHILPNYIAKKFSKELNLSESEVKSANVSKRHVKYEQSIEASETQLRSEFPHVGEDNDKEFYERMLHMSGAKIVFYMHGNSGSRAASHRVELYNVLRAQGYHVIAFDYRGYGDSLPNAPSEAGLVNDAVAVYKYVQSVTKSNPVFAWGHSLGTGVGCHTLAKLKKLNIAGPKLLVLESPFNNIRDEVREHPFSRFFRNLPWFDMTIVDPMFESNLRFESDKHIATFHQPVLILHAEDDIVVPYKLGRKLYQSALDKRQQSWGPVEFHRFYAESGYGHKFICRAPELPDIFNKFFESYGNENY